MRQKLGFTGNTTTWRRLLLISDFRNLRWGYGRMYGPFPLSFPFPIPPSFKLWMNFSGAIINVTYILAISTLLSSECLTRNGCVKGNPKIESMRSVITTAWNFGILSQDVYDSWCTLQIVCDPHVKYTE